ncbi:PQQ-dependent sugar dehydrogenase [Stappia sp. ES.058]|uniref:PQQ-dependent sugar dehydrogenase n=1 Tax=Stappia sp. ES.058 TaxID=1881061 RepID=UPI00087DB97A|nr:PQQ-dependent sugar dehydrogenase [Stappia sp. ES.058]SDU28402.1 Glucose/arabinose dehydrogenase, beta-propeller fold [Stappia sp. ES.058]
MRFPFKGLGLAAVIGLASLPQALAQQVHEAASARFTVTKMVDGLDYPWGFDFLPDGSLLVNEVDGRMLWVSADLGQRVEVAGVPEVRASGQGGLLDVVVAPDFTQTGDVFLTYSEPGPGGAGTTAARARLLREDGTVRLADVKVIARMDKKTRGGRHFGSRVIPAPDGTVYVTTGDRGEAERAQDPFDHAGSVLRVARDGGIPADNPFANGEKALPEMWSTGHRNIQGAAVEPGTGRLWTVEHGARGGDEINVPRAGLNYGWPVISYGRHYSGGRIGVGTTAKGYEQPVHYWDPSIAPSGMAFYSGDAIPAWTDDLFVGALKDQLISRLEVENGAVTNEERLVVGDYGRIRTLRNGPGGTLWFSTDEADGALYRISAAP